METEGKIISISQIVGARVDFLSRGRMAKGMVTVMDGDPGLGKSTLAVEWSARISRGEALPNGERSAPGNVIYLAGEDSYGYTVKPRLVAAGADLNRVKIIVAKDQDGEREIELPRDFAILEAAMAELSCALLVLDPLEAFVDDSVDLTKSQPTRRMISHLTRVCEQTGSPALMLRNLNKMTSQGGVYRGAGSMAIIGSARFGLIVAQAKDPMEFELASLKCNIGLPPRTLAYRLASVEGTDVARIEYSGETGHDAQWLLGRKDDAEDPQMTRAELWLADRLRQLGVAEVATLRFLAEADHQPWSSVSRAARNLGVLRDQRGHGPGSKTYWSLRTECLSPGMPITGGDTHYSASLRQERMPITDGVISPAGEDDDYHA